MFHSAINPDILLAETSAAKIAAQVDISIGPKEDRSQVLRSENASRSNFVIYKLVHRKRILTRLVSSSSGERIVSINGNRGAAVAAASHMISSRAKGTMRISRTTK
jgi:hypothetical protein